MTREAVDLPTQRTGIFDPADGLTLLREQQPLCRLCYTNGELGWLVTSHALARTVLTDARFGRGDLSVQRDRSAFADPTRLVMFEKALKPYGDWRPMRGFIEMDPPDHTRFRRLLAPHFTARRMGELRPRIEEIAANRLSDMQREGPPVDLVRLYAAPISLESQCALLGIPADQAERFFRLGTAMSDVAAPVEHVVGLWREAWEYVRELASARRLDPTDDVISDIARHDDLTDDEVADTALVIFQGGLETTGDMLALCVFLLLYHPEQMALLRSRTAAIEGAIEELLRYAGIFRFVARTALEDVQIGEFLVEAGETVTVSLATANRDPNQFTHPDDLDLTRAPTGHVAFAKGVHTCMGQHLARAELQVALTALIVRLPTLRLAIRAEDVPVYAPEMGMFGVHQLPVTW